GCLTIASVTIIVLFTAFTSQFFVIWPYIGPINTRSIIITLSLNSFLLMIVINYFLTCTTDPGRVPNNWMPRQQAYIEVKKSTHTPRFCRTCKNFKPPRSHHCSRCGRCVLKMDHHCPWVNNCIGFANYGHFIRLLIYINISAVYIFTLLACRLAQLTRSSQFQLDITEIVFMSINLMITASAILGVGALSCYHIFYISTNTTTIEAWEKGRSLTIKRMESVKNIKYPYNRGIYKNLTAVLGKRPIFWLIPQPTTGNGFEFSIDDD
ncbi:zf-DHHC-domain-containing protein, partial [Mycotypha africana]|uniref:zf-DHHC-domain-containing protein n=1 Tax=Mycotypha africana TaxID=64632 RepID=UPI002300B37D